MPLLNSNCFSQNRQHEKEGGSSIDVGGDLFLGKIRTTCFVSTQVFTAHSSSHSAAGPNTCCVSSAGSGVLSTSSLILGSARQELSVLKRPSSRHQAVF